LVHVRGCVEALAWTKRGFRSKTASGRQTARLLLRRSPHESYRTTFYGDCHVRRPLGSGVVQSPTPARRTLWRPSRRRATTEDLGTTGRSRTSWRRSQQSGGLLPHQSLGPRRLAFALARVRYRLSQGTQQRSSLPHLSDS